MNWYIVSKATITIHITVGLGRTVLNRGGVEGYVTTYRSLRMRLAFGAADLAVPVFPATAAPYMGWSNWSLQTTTISGYGVNWPDQYQMQVQSNELVTTLQPYGYKYFNLDSGWSGGFDGYGRPTPGSRYSNGIPWIANIVHNNGQKLGIYWIPGVGTDVYNANPPIY